MIKKRIGKADYEMTFASQCDVIIVNDDLELAKKETEKVIGKFLKK
jgi:guanylate kinase